MAEKLRLILKRTPWSLVARAVVVSILWLRFPFWLFGFVSLSFYFFPFFRPAAFLLPFVLMLALAAILTPNGIAALLLGTIFFLILGIKDLIFIKREQAYKLAIALLLFLVFLNFFAYFENWQRPLTFFWSLVMSALFFFLAKGLFDYGGAGVDWKKKLFVLGMGTLLVWQISFAVLFLPMHFFSQAVFLLVVAVVFLEISLDYLRGRLGKEKIMGEIISFVLLTTLILATTRWSL